MTKDEAMKLALEALALAQDNLRDHGDNCFLHDEGEFNRCFCGKDSLSNHLQSVVEKLEEALAEQPAQQQEPVAWCPDVCPITGLPFFMWIEHHETGQNVPTYGGPYDSYTIPVRDKDGSYCRERYDHDLGGWRADEVEDVGIQIVSDQAYVSDYEPPASKPLTDEQRKKLRDAFAQALTSVYVCGRVWEAWQYGTMSEGDFQPASECTEVLDSLIEAAHEITGETK